jgi:predicted phosphoribosyltransferase
MFRDRQDAGRRLAQRLKGRPFQDPLVLAIPRGGLVIGAALARELGAELDVVLARKLRAPGQPELALGAVGEDGRVVLNHGAEEVLGGADDYLAEEIAFQLSLLARRRARLRAVRPPAPVAGRSVILTDDGIATGATLTAALKVVKAQGPRELIVAVPVACAAVLDGLRPLCDEIFCLHSPHRLWAVGQWYEEFHEVEDQQVLDILRQFAPSVCL